MLCLFIAVPSEGHWRSKLPSQNQGLRVLARFTLFQKMNPFRYQSLAKEVSHRLAFFWLFLLNLPLPRRLFNRLGRRPNYLSFLTLHPNSLDGLTVTLDPTDSSQVIIFDEVFLDHIYDFSPIPFKPTCIIDCGGHIGLFTLTASHCFPKVPITVFEPNPDNFAYLKAQISKNDLPAQLVEAAVSTHVGEVSFNAGNSCSGRMVEASPGADRVFTVHTVDLRDFLVSAQSQRLLLKMDIEGAEMELIPQIITHLPSETAFFFETHGGDNDWNAIQTLLSDHGFAVTRTSSRGPYSDGFALRADFSSQ
jgi:FkbM family methyltransferase